MKYIMTERTFHGTVRILRPFRTCSLSYLIRSYLIIDVDDCKLTRSRNRLHNYVCCSNVL
jgi:hypothetical protein